MDGIVGGVPASGPSGWQGGEVFSEVQRWNRIEADGQMKTPCESGSSVAEPFDRAEGFCYTYDEVLKSRKRKERYNMKQSWHAPGAFGTATARRSFPVRELGNMTSTTETSRPTTRRNWRRTAPPSIDGSN